MTLLASLMNFMEEHNGCKINERIDNSIDAKAQNIFIVAINKQIAVNTRTQNNIKELAVLDDGIGMDTEAIGHCLSLGWGSKIDSREGLGRFGFGLKGSSISQCRQINVYSWQGGINNCQSITMDIDKIVEDDLDELPDPETAKLPELYTNLFANEIGESGTLVVWEKLENVDVKKTDALVRRLNKEMCRTYRHYLDVDDDYGTRRNIRVLTVDGDKKTISENLPLLANDPLYLLQPSNIPGHENEQLFTEWNEIYTKEIGTPKGTGLKGSSDIGAHCEANTGVSFVRGGREIDFGDFGYLLKSDPRNRWWGIEVRFDPILDEIFGVTNNKQYVRNIKCLSSGKKAELNDIVSMDEKDFDYYKSQGLLTINREIERLVSELMVVVKTRGKGSRTKQKQDDPTKQVNIIIGEDPTPTHSDKTAETKTTNEKKNNLIDLFGKSDASLKSNEIETLVEEALDYKVDLLLGSWPGDLFLDVQFPANGVMGCINREHNFYDTFWSYLEEADDGKAMKAMKILLMSYVRAEDEMLTRYPPENFQKLRNSWGKWCHELLNIVD